jgi:hypothetical protein
LGSVFVIAAPALLAVGIAGDLLVAMYKAESHYLALAVAGVDGSLALLSFAVLLYIRRRYDAS